jgi:hypothetical protein|tara:strand:+ start:140 stop:310 length:171 start_codon:yes stop_codon:yes gene_type:complete
MKKFPHTSYFLIKIDHDDNHCPEALATKMVGGQGCIDLKVVEIEPRSKKTNPYIAY